MNKTVLSETEVVKSTPNKTAKKPSLHFNLAEAVNYQDAQRQIAEHVADQLYQDGFSVTQSNSAVVNQSNVSFFIRRNADIYIGHNLADKNYLLQRNKQGEAYINQFQHVMVPGNWARERLLQSRYCHLKPHQIHLIGSPRVDYLRQLASQQSEKPPLESGSKRNVLWAPAHNQWALKGETLGSYPVLQEYLDVPAITENATFNITPVPHPRNRKNKQAVTQQLLDADVVISDYSSVIYEAWALGKPVVFPRWLLGDKVLEKASHSAEAHIYRERIGYHADSFEEFCDLLNSDLVVSEGVQCFMQDYLHNYQSPGAAKQASQLMQRFLDADYLEQQQAHYIEFQNAIDRQEWDEANRLLGIYTNQYNNGLPLVDTQRVSSDQRVVVNAITQRALVEHKQAVAEKRWLDAENGMRNLLELVNDDALVYNRLAQALRKQGKWWQEVEALKSAIALESHHPTWHYRLGEAQEVMNRFQAAAHSYGMAIALKVGEAEAEAQWYYRQGYCFAREGHDGPANQQAAESAYATAIEKDTKLNAQRFGIGVFHQQRGHWPQAKKAYYNQLKKQTWDAELNYRLGMAYDRCYEWAEAETCYKNALTIDKEQPNWHYRLGFVLERQEKFEQAAIAYQYAALNHEKHTAYWFYRWAYVLEKQGRYEEATQAYLQTCKQQTLDKQTELAGGGELTESENDITTLDNFQTSQNTIALKTYASQFDNQQFIIDALEKHLETDTTNPDYWFQLGNAYERQQNWHKAADVYQHALDRKNEHSPEWYYRLGYVLLQAEQHQEASEVLRETRILQKPYGVPEDKFNKDASFRQASTYGEYYERLPVKDKTILYESYGGVGMSCNPYAIFKNMIFDDLYSDWLHIWVVNDLSCVDVVFKDKKNIVFIRKDSNLYLQYLSSTKYLVNNSTFPYYYIRKEGQKYLNTWHGTPLKTLGMDIKDNPLQRANTARNLLQTSHFISPNKHTTEVMIERYGVKGLFNGIVAQTGYPRIDLSFNADKYSVRNKVGILDERPVILYAPTYRGIWSTPEIEVDRLVYDLSRIKSSEYNILFRGHYFAEEEIKKLNLPVNIVPHSVDSCELLSIVDLLITDYSSIFFDFLGLKKPIIHYVYDYEDYQRERGLYFNKEDFPGYVCETIEDLNFKIDNLINNNFPLSKNHLKAIKEFAPFEDANATNRVISFFIDEAASEAINEIKADPIKSNILFYGSPFDSNGITSSLINLCNSIDHDKYNTTVIIGRDALLSSPERQGNVDKLNSSTEVIVRSGRMVSTIEEQWIIDKFSSQKIFHNESMRVIYDNAFKREGVRIVGLNNNVHMSIDFHGYRPFWASLFCNIKSKYKSIYLHNNMFEENVMRFPHLSGVFNLYGSFDKLISVSKSVHDDNKNILISKFNCSPSKFCYVNNPIDIESIASFSEANFFSDDYEIFDNDNRVKFLNAARLSPEKGHEKLIQAFNEIVKNNDNVALYLLGKGPEKNNLKKMVKDMNLEDVVIFSGHQENPFPFIKNADCFVLSSDHEGQGLVLLEALSLGTTCISTDIPGPQSVLDDDLGLLVENSVFGLAQGMQDFLDNKLTFKSFDPKVYQENAINMFYEKVIG